MLIFAKVQGIMLFWTAKIVRPSIKRKQDFFKISGLIKTDYED